MKKQFSLAILAFSTLLTGGCSGILTSDQPPKLYYLLQPLESAAAAQAENGQPALAVSVGAIPGLDTDRILALGPDARLQRYANARWPDHLPEVLTSVVARSMAGTGRFSVIDGSGSGEGWVLTLEARQFHGLRGGSEQTSEVRVELAGQILCHGQAHAVGAAAAVDVRVERLASVVAAHQAGLDQVTREIIDQIEARCAG